MMIHAAVFITPPLGICGLTDIFKAHTKSIFFAFFSLQFLRTGIKYVSKGWKGRLILRLVGGTFTLIKLIKLILKKTPNPTNS